MRFLRKMGMYVSLSVMGAVHATRHILWKLRGREHGVQGVRVILVDERRVVLVAHWYAPWLWTLPGGGVRRGEQPEQAAVREAREETGFEVKSIAGEIGTYTGMWGAGDTVRVYYSGDFEGSLSIKPNFEIMARSWFPIDDLPEELSPANRRRVESYRAGVRGEIGRW